MDEFPLIAGILASVFHVFSGSDHLAAVTPLAIETDRKTWKIGLFWGLGHVLGMLFLGLLFIGFKNMFPLEIISKYSDRLAGFILIILGFWTSAKVFKDKLFIKLFRKNKGYFSVILEPLINNKKLKRNLKIAFYIGSLHGIAGIYHFLLLFPTIGYKNMVDSTSYVGGFILGTLIAMVIYSTLIQLLSSCSDKNRQPILILGLRFCSGFFAIIVGLLMI